MVAFDPQLLGNLFAVPAFAKKYGVLIEGSYAIPDARQTGLSMGNSVGRVILALLPWQLVMEGYGTGRGIAKAQALYRQKKYFTILQASLVQ